MSYIRKDFLLNTPTAQKLYFEYATDMPIFDYHCHLPERQILENQPFSDLYEIWLAGDHYKWRLMRNYGVDEDYITGDRSNKEKFLAYCRVLGTAFGNPLYHWSQVELQEFFACELEINEKNAEAIWEQCNAYIRENRVTPQSLIERSNVKHLYTTNEIFDELETFREIAKKGYAFDVAPAFRADRIMNIDGANYTDFIARVEKQTHPIASLSDLESAIEKRLQAFIAVGTTAADVALQSVYPIAEKADAEAVFAKRRKGEAVTQAESEIFKGYLTYFLFKLYAKYNIATELHVGAMRNNNEVMLRKLGLDTGFVHFFQETLVGVQVENALSLNILSAGFHLLTQFVNLQEQRLVNGSDRSALVELGSCGHIGDLAGFLVYLVACQRVATAVTAGLFHLGEHLQNAHGV